jgi:hypothetical protein
LEKQSNVDFPISFGDLTWTSLVPSKMLHISHYTKIISQRWKTMYEEKRMFIHSFINLMFKICFNVFFKLLHIASWGFWKIKKLNISLKLWQCLLGFLILPLFFRMLMSQAQKNTRTRIKPKTLQGKQIIKNVTLNLIQNYKQKNIKQECDIC